MKGCVDRVILNKNLRLDFPHLKPEACCAMIKYAGSTLNWCNLSRVFCFFDHAAALHCAQSVNTLIYTSSDRDIVNGKMLFDLALLQKARGCLYSRWSIFGQYKTGILQFELFWNRRRAQVSLAPLKIHLNVYLVQSQLVKKAMNLLLVNCGVLGSLRSAGGARKKILLLLWCTFILKGDAWLLRAVVLRIVLRPSIEVDASVWWVEAGDRTLPNLALLLRRHIEVRDLKLVELWVAVLDESKLWEFLWLLIMLLHYASFLSQLAGV